MHVAWDSPFFQSLLPAISWGPFQCSPNFGDPRRVQGSFAPSLCPVLCIWIPKRELKVDWTEPPRTARLFRRWGMLPRFHCVENNALRSRNGITLLSRRWCYACKEILGSIGPLSRKLTVGLNLKAFPIYQSLFRYLYLLE
jgi:hypothetical protein